MSEFANKTVLVTGSNRGIGKSIVERFAKAGANIVACARKETSEFVEYILGLSKEYNVNITTLFFDLSDENSIKEAIKSLYSNKIKIDVLINNAGVVSMKLLQMTSMDELKDIFQINFFAQVHITQGVSKLMMRQKSGVIVNLCSVGGIDAFPAYTAYGCSKAAMAYFTKTMAKELATYNIRVNAVAPGLVETDMKSDLTEKANNEVFNRTALNRSAKAEEIADTILYLASDKASYITGQIIRIDGGM